ncbi:hypothetical protein KGP26_20455 [Serratia sp. JSRIV002]|uniref:hypothetical protein n=1 Tax=Serratia sp. JSRIV002 TaxID=2831894 RepID=UPI001CBCB3DB|nr:hypothetical protein [Serratia sp. JSRIV002]UAN50098.1 hypothetical protein KGP26_20455 [Serratia sp. JSRIV002]
MACKCFEKYEESIKESINKKNHDQIGEIVTTGFEHSLWHFSGGDHSPIAMNYQFRYFRKRKNGQNESRLTKADHLVTMNYCPFCGAKFEGDKHD